MASWDELMPPEDPFSVPSQQSCVSQACQDPFSVPSQQSRIPQSRHFSTLGSSRSTVEQAPYSPLLHDVTENLDITDSQLISRSRFQRSSGQLPSALTRALKSSIFSQSQRIISPLTSVDINQSQPADLSSPTNSLDVFETGKHDKSQVSPLQPPSSRLQATQSSRPGIPGYAPTIISQTPQPLTFKRKPDQNDGECGSQMVLRQVAELPEKYRHIFAFPYFNAVQSAVMNDALYSDKSLVVSAPTGSGKTAVFELAIIRLLSFANLSSFKIVYMAPIKALCSERCQDWQSKFSPLDIKCSELTGDTEEEDCHQLHNASIILTTPEKWDSMSRKWRDNKSLVKLVKLFLIDEVHSVNDDVRGPTVEAVISRMKTVKATTCTSSGHEPTLRFVAVSATIPNIEDLSEWIGDSKSTAIYHKFDEAYRPVPLKKYVHGYYYNEKSSPYKFDLSLNYQISKIITQYSNQKPTLVFCSTRKGTQTAADVLAKESFSWNFKPRHTLQSEATLLKDAKLRDLVCKGVGYHHAGLDRDDRDKIQNMFLEGKLPVLMATSTLAFGVNLPAHLVILKSTQYYASGQYTEYSETQVIQMMGRAGRPQFDTSATVVIMTRNQTKAKYESLTAGEKYLESSFHTRLIEHLNAEIVLHTINDTSIAVEWLKSTLLYVRIRKNPTHYGIRASASQDDIEKHLMGICVSDLNRLSSIGAINMDDEGFDVKSTDIGQLMARYCICFDTMKTFCNIKGDVDLEEMITILSSCREFADIQLRMNERRLLNTLNKDRNHVTVRFPTDGKIKSTPLKVNCLIQATLGCLPIQEFSLQQDALKIFRVGARVSKCLYELMQQRGDYKSLLNAALLAKCFKAKLWENSRYVSRQIERIGSTLSTALVNAGVGSFTKLLETNPRQLELIVNRHPPFGNQILEAVSHLPVYKLDVLQSSKHASSSAEITVTICLENRERLLQKQTTNRYHCALLLIGNADDEIILKKKIMDTTLLNSIVWSRTLTLQRAKSGDDITINYVSQEYVGLDVLLSHTIEYTNARYTTNSKQGGRAQPKLQTYLRQAKAGRAAAKSTSPQSEEDIEWSPSATQGGTKDGRKACNHKCANKGTCGHLCCRIGVAIKPPPRSKSEKRQLVMSGSTPRKQKTMDAYLSQLHTRTNCMPSAPQIKRQRVDNQEYGQKSLKKFIFKPRTTMPSVHSRQNESHADQDSTTNISTSGSYQNVTPLSSTSLTTKPRLTGILPADRGTPTANAHFSAGHAVGSYGRGLAPTGLAASNSGLTSHGTGLISACVDSNLGRSSAGLAGNNSDLTSHAMGRSSAGLATNSSGLASRTTVKSSATNNSRLAKTGQASHDAGGFGTPARHHSSSGCPATPARGWEHLDVYLNRSKVPESPTCAEYVDEDIFDLPEVDGICDPIVFQPRYNPPKAQRRLIMGRDEYDQKLLPTEEQPDSILSTSSGQLVPCRSFRLGNPKASSRSFSRQAKTAVTHDDFRPLPPDTFNRSFSDEEFYASEGSCEMADDPVTEEKLPEVQNIHLPVDAIERDTRNDCVSEQLPIILCSSSEEDVYHFEGSCGSPVVMVVEDRVHGEEHAETNTFDNFRVELGAKDESQSSADFDFYQEECKVEIGQDMRSSTQQIPLQSFFGPNDSMRIDEADTAFNSIFDDIF